MIIEDKNCEEKQNNNNENIKLQLQRENQNDFEIKANEKTTKKNECSILLVNDNNQINQKNLKKKTTENNEKINKSNDYEINNKKFYDFEIFLYVYLTKIFHLINLMKCKVFCHE